MTWDNINRVHSSGWSGGERQRFGLARLFIQNPDIVVVDEGTSAIDADTETQVNINLREWFQGKTTILIAYVPIFLEVIHLGTNHSLLLGTDYPRSCTPTTYYFYQTMVKSAKREHIKILLLGKVAITHFFSIILAMDKMEYFVANSIGWILLKIQSTLKKYYILQRTNTFKPSL